MDRDFDHIWSIGKRRSRPMGLSSEAIDSNSRLSFGHRIASYISWFRIMSTFIVFTLILIFFVLVWVWDYAV